MSVGSIRGLDCWARSCPRTSKQIGAEAVDAHVGLADGELLRVARLLLHHAEHVPVGIADHAAVAERILHVGAHQHTGGVAFGLLVDQPPQCGDAQQRRIAVEHHQIAIEMGHGFAADHHGMAGAFLLCLLDEADARRGHRLPDFFGLMAHDDEDAVRRGQLQSGIHDVLQQGFSAGLVEYLRMAALHAGAESGSENHDGNGLVHLFHYAFLRRRPSWASCTRAAAVTVEAWRTLPL